MALLIKGLRLPKPGRWIKLTLYYDGVVKFNFGGDFAGQAVQSDVLDRIKALAEGIRNISEIPAAVSAAEEIILQIDSIQGEP